MRKEPEHVRSEQPFQPRPHSPGFSSLPVEAEFENGLDPHQRAEFLKQARGILDAIERGT